MVFLKISKKITLKKKARKLYLIFGKKSWLPTRTRWWGHIVFDFDNPQVNLIIIRSDGPSYTWRRPNLALSTPLSYSPNKTSCIYNSFYPLYPLPTRSHYTAQSFIRISKFSVSLSMATIKSIKARQIFDSRGNPTVEVCTPSFISHIYLNRWFRCCVHCPFSDLFIPLDFLHLNLLDISFTGYFSSQRDSYSILIFLIIIFGIW